MPAQSTGTGGSSTWREALGTWLARAEGKQAHSRKAVTGRQESPSFEQQLFLHARKVFEAFPQQQPRQLTAASSPGARALRINSCDKSPSCYSDK